MSPRARTASAVSAAHGMRCVSLLPGVFAQAPILQAVFAVKQLSQSAEIEEQAQSKHSANRDSIEENHLNTEL